MEDNISYSEEWLIKQIIKEFDKEKKTGKKTVVKMNKLDLYKFVLKFIKINRQ